ncbi:PorV/PorQ family protein [candidate division KSB1 bacterium]|nr:PorV/PorQ family protein [candidate division KSB1 bacterium]
MNERKNLFINGRSSRAWSQAIVLMLGLAFFTATGWAQTVSGVGTSAAAFLKIGVGGRALGMGEALATQAEDVTALFWNPAGLASISRTQILINHFDYIVDMSYEYAGIALPMRNVGTFGFFFSYLGMPDIERTTITMPEGTGEMVRAGSFAAGISFGRALTDRFAIGGTAKFVKETIWHSTASGVAADIGVMYRTFFKNLRIGMSISNFGSDMRMNGRDMLVQHDIDVLSDGNNANINANLDTDAFPMPILFRVGISANFTRDFFNLNGHDLIVAVDAVHPSDNKEYLNVGGEYCFKNLLAFRAGYRQLFLEDRQGGLTAGIGLHVKVMGYALSFDYANIDYGVLDRQNKFSFILTL